MKIIALVAKEKVEKFTDFQMVPKDADIAYYSSGETEKMIKEAADAEVLLVNAMTPVEESLISAFPDLKMIHSEGVAYNRIDLEAAKKRGIYVCNAKAANAGQVAEHAIMLMMNVIKHYEEGLAEIRKGNQKDIQGRFISSGLSDIGAKSVGIVGFGAIGRELAKRLKPFGCRLYYYDPFPADAKTEEMLGISKLGFEEILKTCDIVSMHLPVTPETTGIINKNTLGIMKKDAVLINTARGEIVNTKDLAEAIKEGTIAGAGIDTLAPEPVTADNPLVSLKPPYSYRVVLTPHTAGTTFSAFKNMYRIFWTNVGLLSKGKKPGTVVNGL